MSSVALSHSGRTTAVTQTAPGKGLQPGAVVWSRKPRPRKRRFASLQFQRVDFANVRLDRWPDPRDRRHPVQTGDRRQGAVIYTKACEMGVDRMSLEVQP